jgi:glutathione S-transferase
MRPRLVTIPFSHYCEKARWALDRARVDYREEPHAPGFHRFATSGRSVPVLHTAERSLFDSSEIIVWADGRAKEKLFPSDEGLTRTFDDELGPHARRFAYFHVLPNLRWALTLMRRSVPQWQRTFIVPVFPLLRLGMRRMMKIDRTGADRSRDKVRRIFDEVGARLSDGRPFLCGDRFTAADLVFASLSAPVLAPEGYRGNLPAPEGLGGDFLAEVRSLRETPAGRFTQRTYREER